MTPERLLSFEAFLVYNCRIVLFLKLVYNYRIVLLLKMGDPNDPSTPVTDGEENTLNIDRKSVV